MPLFSARNPAAARGATAATSSAVPLGGKRLMVELSGEMIPYTPEELIAIGEKEFAWCEAEMKKASRQMGFGDDWKKALEKSRHARAAGRTAGLIRDLAREAIDYLREARPDHDSGVAARNLADGHDVAAAAIGESVLHRRRDHLRFVSASAMSYDAEAAEHARQQHSLLAGHGVSRIDSRPHCRVHDARVSAASPRLSARRSGAKAGRSTGSCCCTTWASPTRRRDRVGALFWRMHRCARIMFSLNFHLGKWTPQQCIDFLVDRVGHERDNAAGESAAPSTAVRAALSGRLPARRAAIARAARGTCGVRQNDRSRLPRRRFEEGSMPVAMVRASLGNQKLTRDYRSDWRFYEGNKK